MKEGMPITVTPNAVTTPKATALANASRMAIHPGSGTFAIFTLAS